MLAKTLNPNHHVYTGHSKEKETKKGARENSGGDIHSTLSPCKGSGCLRLKWGGGGEMGRLRRCFEEWICIWRFGFDAWFGRKGQSLNSWGWSWWKCMFWALRFLFPAHFTTPAGSQNPWSHNRNGTLVPLVQVLEKTVWSSTATGGR